MAANVKLLKYLGEDILAEILEETDTTFTVKNPVRVVVVPNKADPKNPSVGFAPWCDWSDDKEVVLTKTMFIAKLEPLTLFINQYNSQFGGLIVPDSKIIV